MSKAEAPKRRGRPPGSKNKKPSLKVVGDAPKKRGRPPGSSKKSFYDKAESLTEQISRSTFELEEFIDKALEEEERPEEKKALAMVSKAIEELNLDTSAIRDFWGEAPFTKDYTPGAVPEVPLEWVPGGFVKYKDAFAKAFGISGPLGIVELHELGKGPGMGTHVVLTNGTVAPKSQLELVSSPLTPSMVEPHIRKALPVEDDFETDVRPTILKQGKVAVEEGDLNEEE